MFKSRERETSKSRTGQSIEIALTYERTLQMAKLNAMAAERAGDQ
jgi:hypothetical protein